jgi:hypothetical protein
MPSNADSLATLAAAALRTRLLASAQIAATAHRERAAAAACCSNRRVPLRRSSSLSKAQALQGAATTSAAAVALLGKPGGAQHAHTSLLAPPSLTDLIPPNVHEGHEGASATTSDVQATAAAAAQVLPLRKSLHGRGVEVVDGVKDVEEDSGVCGVCWSAEAEVAAAGCGHAVCSSCAVRLVEGVKKRPLACPFCRGVVAGFVPVAQQTSTAAAAGAAAASSVNAQVAEPAVPA